MITIYHNNRCSKSRLGVEYLKSKGLDFEIKYYLEENLDFDALSEILKKLNIKPIDLVRTKEKDWIDHFRGKNLTDQEIIQAMVEFPKLIERPVVINGNKGVIGRPIEQIDQILL